jgi:hydrogenase maturation protein HypF
MRPWPSSCSLRRAPCAPEHGIIRLGLTGGVFQNRNLCERICRLANRDDLAVQLAERVPCNDAGLSFGQVIEASARA